MDELTTEQAGELRLPQHDRWNGDEIVWGARLEPVTLQCSKCGAKIPRTLSLPDSVTISENISFVCRECNSARAKRRGRPHKASLESGQPETLSPLNGQAEPKSEVEESVLIGALSAGLAGFSPVLPKRVSAV